MTLHGTIKMSEYPDEGKKSNGQPPPPPTPSQNEQYSCTLEKENYRRISTLPILSKLYEMSINVQLMEYFNIKFHTYLSVFRLGYGCHCTLLRITEDWKQALDDKKYIAAILLAFDLPHDLLLLKLQYYGLSHSA